MEVVPIFLGMNRWDPSSDWPGDEAKLDLWISSHFARSASCASQRHFSVKYRMIFFYMMYYVS